MSLTEREKELALECARKGDLCVDEECLVVSRGDVLDMFDDFLSRIREEQEAAAYMYQHEDTGQVGFVDQQQIEWGFEKHNPRLQLIGPLFTTPPAAPCDCSELVEALQEAYTQVKELCDCHNHPYPLASFERYDEAIANHAKRTKAGEE